MRAHHITRKIIMGHSKTDVVAVVVVADVDVVVVVRISKVTKMMIKNRLSNTQHCCLSEKIFLLLICLVWLCTQFGGKKHAGSFKVSMKLKILRKIEREGKREGELELELEREREKNFERAIRETTKKVKRRKEG